MIAYVSQRRSAILTRSLAAGAGRPGFGSRVPDADLGLHAVDGAGVGLGELDVRALLDHHCKK